MPFKTAGSPYYQFNRRITIDGVCHRVRGSTGTRNRREAERIEEEAVAAYRAAVRAPIAAGLTLDSLLGTYFDQVARHQPSWRVTASQMRVLLRGIDGQRHVASLTTADLAAWIAKRRATVSNATVNRGVEMLKRACRWATRTLGAAAPAIDWGALHLTEPPGIVRQLTTDEEARLMAVMPPDLRAIVTFALITGCRVSTACGLEWRDVDWQARTIAFRTMKGGRGHVVPLSSDLAELLGNLPRVGPHVFMYLHIGPRGPELRPYLTSSWRYRWDKAIEAAKITDFRRHDLRHTALSRTTRVAGLRTAQQLAGHSSITTTARYAHCELDDVRRALEARAGQTVARVAEHDEETDMKATG